MDDGSFLPLLVVQFLKQQVSIIFKKIAQGIKKKEKCSRSFSEKTQMPAASSQLWLLLSIVAFLLLNSILALDVGINIDPSNANGGNPTTPIIAATGSRWARFEWKASFSASSYTSIVQSLNANNIRTLIILDYDTVVGAPWGGTAAQWESYASAFVPEVQSIAASLSSMNGGFEVWNEEDLSATSVPAASYAALLRRSYKAIKAVNRSLMVVMGGLASGNPGYVQQVMSANSGVLYADEVGLHPYGQRPFPNWPSSSWGFGYVGSLIDAYVAVVPSGVKMFITEVGTQDVSVEGIFPWMMFDSLQSAPLSAHVSNAIWFCWSDGMVSSFGLVTASGVHKADYASFVNFTGAGR